MCELNSNHPSRFFIRKTNSINISTDVSDYIETRFIIGYNYHPIYDYNKNKLILNKRPITITVCNICLQ